MSLSLVMTASFWNTLYRHLIRVTPENPYPDEQLAFILASVSRSPLGTRLLAREMLLASPADFIHQSPVGLKPKHEFVAPIVDRCRIEGWSFIEVHSHPFDGSEKTSFSSIDWSNDRIKMPSLAKILKDFSLHATVVVGQKAVDAHFYDKKSKQILPLQQIMLVGNTLQYIPITGAKQRVPTKEVDERYARQQFLDQPRLKKMTVAIVGLGGLGSFVALELAHLGIGHLILIDHDTVERKNLNRLVGASVDTIGQRKVEVYAKLIRNISETTQVTTIPVSLLDRDDNAAREYVKGADVIFGCVDNNGTRLILNQIAVRYMVPLIDGGSGVQLAHDSTPLIIGGQTHVVLPGAGCLQCRGYIHPQRAAFDLAPKHVQDIERALGYGTEKEAPSVISLNGVIASLQVTELLFLLSDSSFGEASAPPINTYILLKRQVMPIVSSHMDNEYCPTCGIEGVVGIGDLSPIDLASTDPAGEPIPKARE